MTRRVLAVFVLLASCAQVVPNVVSPAGLDFTRTMRVDYFHSGGPGEEAAALDTVIVEGPWAGSRTQLIDRTNLGKYYFDVVDPVSSRVLYSRGFASIYGEWETTPEFRTTRRTFHESLRFPWPGATVRVALKKRDRQNVFVPLWEIDVDPAAASGRTSFDGMGRAPAALFVNGPESRKVDVLLLSDGYSPDQERKFRADASRLVKALFAREPFKTRRSDFNFRILFTGSAGPSSLVEFNIFGLERYALTYDNRLLRNAAAAAPYDIVQVLMNETKYGGGGIFNQQSTVAAGNESAEYVFIHEFAHNLAGLGDEYVGTVTYETGAEIKAEPWEPNITALHDPAALKWRDLVDPATPVPTPMSFAGKVGAFEGAGYESRGLYRPEAACIMGSRTVDDFCRVCRRAINRIIDLHTN